MKKAIVNSFSQAIQYSVALSETNELLQSIELGLAILCSLIIIVPKIIEWYKKASADGKITKEEVEELKEDLKEDIKNFKKGE